MGLLDISGLSQDIDVAQDIELSHGMGLSQDCMFGMGRLTDDWGLPATPGRLPAPARCHGFLGYCHRLPQGRRLLAYKYCKSSPYMKEVTLRFEYFCLSHRSFYLSENWKAIPSGMENHTWCDKLGPFIIEPKARLLRGVFFLPILRSSLCNG